MLGRIFAGVFAVLSVFLLPWWVVVLLLLAGAFYFNFFFEMVFCGFLLDAIYGSSLVGNGFPYLFSLILLITFGLIVKFKKNLIMY